MYLSIAESLPTLSFILCFSKIRSLAKKYGVTLRRSDFLSKERKVKCRGLLQDYYTAALDRLTTMAKEARRMIASNRHQMFTKGEVHPERSEKAEQLLIACRKFHEAVSLLADAVDKEPPPSVETLVSGVSLFFFWFFITL